MTKEEERLIKELRETLKTSESLLKRLRPCNRDFLQEIDAAIAETNAALRKGAPIMTEDKIKLANQKYLEVTELRKHEATLGLSEFQRGQLAGAQQALAWIGMDYLEPIRTILTDKQLERIPNHD